MAETEVSVCAVGVCDGVSDCWFAASRLSRSRRSCWLSPDCCVAVVVDCDAAELEAVDELLLEEVLRPLLLDE